MRSPTNKKVSFDKKNSRAEILKCVVFSVILVFCSVLQVSFFEVFGVIAAITLCFVCAIGFVCGENVGGVCGIVDVRRDCLIQKKTLCSKP